MTEINKEKMTAQMDHEFVVFLIGMRINKPWKVHKWLPVVMAMQRMITELRQKPELGFLHHESWLGRTSIMVQYWQSFEHLEQYAVNKDARHVPAWLEFNNRIRANADVGIWHETYLSGQGRYECVYTNMPPFGLGKAGRLIPAVDRYHTARGRM
ncbi:MAG TPA: DUF4188 domain-containing protein, partial [Gammaproteobacteria bacterium]|nr:DUF4188 domain-containing protein [Gammaproteobacteria bacterium]